MLTTFQAVRSRTVAICDKLEVEDHLVAAIAQASPPKWHLAHTSWFFETFLLKPFLAGYVEQDTRYAFLFNSYYEGLGQLLEKPLRALLSRPTLNEIHAYRTRVDNAMAELLTSNSRADRELSTRLRTGLAHEEQHQELLLADIKVNFFVNPLSPAYAREAIELMPLIREKGDAASIEHEGGLIDIGLDQNASDFGFDNEYPRHRVYVEPYTLASRVVTCAEYLAFIEDDGYARAELWLSEGWMTVKKLGWVAPHYWKKDPGRTWEVFTLAGWQPLRGEAPVAHTSFFEADAYARWRGARLPTEAEWEHAATKKNDAFRYGDVWEWTSSSYARYPNNRPLSGALGEYNAKFMCNQYVLRGGSRFTAPGHSRPTYRNYFAPETRWQFSGIRLAQGEKP